MAEKGRRYRQGRRRAGGNRDGQGDNGGRSRRRRYSFARSSIEEGTENVEGEHAHRRHRGRRRGCGERFAPAPKAAAAASAESSLRLRAGRFASSRSRPTQRTCRVDAEIPAGTKMVDDDRARSACATPWPRKCAVTRTRCFVMGEEVAEYQGAYKVTQGLLQEFGAQARHRYADHRTRLCRHVGVGAAMAGPASPSSSS